MKTYLLICSLFLFATAFGQQYKTQGIEQYQKNINGQYVLTGRALSYDATWTFYSDNTFHCYKEGSNCGDYDTKKTKSGNKTTYSFMIFGSYPAKITIEGNKLTYYEGEDFETKMVYRIVKVEKAE